MRPRAGLVAAGVVALLASGCSGPAVDSSCDVDGVSHEVEHIVGESKLELTALETLKCSGSWAFARATVSGEGQAPQSLTFLFKKDETGWFLKSPEIACGSDPGMETVAEDLKSDVCSGQPVSSSG